MKLYKKLTLLLLVALASFAFSCDMPEEEGLINFRVFSADDNFDGWYSVDGEDSITFDGTLMDGSTIFYEFQQPLTAPQHVYIYARGDTNASSVTIQVYVNSILKDDITVGESEGAEYIVNTLEYSFTTTTE